MISQPVELNCGRLVCARCCCKWFELSGVRACPCCYDHQLDENRLQQPSTVVIDALAGLWGMSGATISSLLDHMKCTRVVTAKGTCMLPHLHGSLLGSFCRSPPQHPKRTWCDASWKRVTAVSLGFPPEDRYVVMALHKAFSRQMTIIWGWAWVRLGPLIVILCTVVLVLEQTLGE